MTAAPAPSSRKRRRASSTVRYWSTGCVARFLAALVASISPKLTRNSNSEKFFALRLRSHLTVVNRDGERDDAIGKFIFHRRVAIATAILDQRTQLLRIGDGALGEGFELGGLEIAVQPLRTHAGKQDAARRGGVRREAAADVGC